jgi:hypothetical protein
LSKPKLTKNCRAKEEENEESEKCRHKFFLEGLMKISSSMVFDTKTLCSGSETEGEVGMGVGFYTGKHDSFSSVDEILNVLTV